MRLGGPLGERGDHIYLAQDLEPSERDGEADEIETSWVSLSQVLGMIDREGIEDAKTIIGVSWARNDSILSQRGREQV